MNCLLIAAALCSAALGAPPEPGTGYGAYERTVEDLPDVRSAIIEDDGTVVAALGSGGVVRVGVDGHRSTLIAWWPAGQVSSAEALTRAADGSLLVVDAPRYQILGLTPQGERQVRVDLSSVAVPPKVTALCTQGDRILMADGALPRVLVVDKAGTGNTVAQWVVAPPDNGLSPRLRGIAVHDQDVFVSDAANNRIVVLDAVTGAFKRAWGDRGSQKGMLESPAGLEWDGTALLVTDTLNHRVIRFDAQGKWLDQWGMHAVRPREGSGKIHYPVTASASPDGTRVVVAEPFERRVQVFGHLPPADPKAPKTTPLPANDGIASHFSRELAIDGQTLLVYEPESASALVFDMRNNPPIHVTTLGGPGLSPGLFGQVSTQLVDERSNRIYLVDPIRNAILIFALRRTGDAPHYDPFMGRLVGEVSLQNIAQFAATRAGGPPTLWPVDMARTQTGGFALLDGAGGRVVELDSDLRPVNAWSAPKGAGKLIAPTQLIITPQGEVVIVDSAERALKRYGLSDGSFLGAVALTEAKRPWGLALIPDPTGTKYAVSDASGDALLVVDPAKGSIVHRVVATGSKPGEFWEASAIESALADGRLYVCDHGNHRLQSFQPDGTWESSFGIGRPYVRPRDPKAPQKPTTPVGLAPTAKGAANTLAQFPAPQKLEEGWQSAQSNNGHYTVRWRTIPAQIPLRDPFGLQVQVHDKATGQPSEAELKVSARMPHHAHGMNVEPTVTRTGAGTWEVQNMLFHMPGYWELYFDLRDSGRMERTQGEAMLE